MNKIILSSHLQNLNFEKTLVKQLRNVDIVISGGGDELLANPSDVLVPTNGAPDGTRPNPVGAYPATSTDARRQHGADRHDPGRVPLRRPADGATFDAAGKLVDTDRAEVRPGARVGLGRRDAEQPDPHRRRRPRLRVARGRVS